MTPSLRLCVAALAGGGAGLALPILSWLPAILMAMYFRGLLGLVPGFVVLGIVCGLAAGYTSASLSEGWPIPVAIGAWAIWALGIGSQIPTHGVPKEIGEQTLPLGLLGALVGAAARWRGAARRSPSGLLGAGLLGALGGFAVLALGVLGLGWAAQIGLRPSDPRMDSYSVYLRGMGAALGFVVILATALSAGVPVAAADRTLCRPVTVAMVGLMLFFLLGVLAMPALFFSLSCAVGLFGGNAC